MATAVNSPPAQYEEHVFAPALVILADDLYPRKLEIIREYIQNASDAIDDFRAIAERLGDDSTPQIRVSIQGRSLLIYDNGIGMDLQEVHKLKRIAYSEKREGEHAGYKGIGRLAGFAVSSKLIISSTSFGDPQVHKFEFRVKEFRDELDANKRRGINESATPVINRHTTISSSEIDPTEHFTLVELHEIDERYPGILNPAELREFIGEMAPVGFGPSFTYGERITEELSRRVPNYSPKTIWLTTAAGDRSQVYKPYNDEMTIAPPEFIDILDEGGDRIGFCWAASKGEQILGKMRAVGNKFAIPGDTPERRKRLAGLVYKLFGFSIGDRDLPSNTLFAKDITRALWFTGEIHIIDTNIKPTTDRSDFVDNAARARFYDAAKKVAKQLKNLAQQISDNRKAFEEASNCATQFNELKRRLDNGTVERTDLAARTKELYENLETLKRDCTDTDIQVYVKGVKRDGLALEKRLQEAKSRKAKKDEINDLARELGMTTQARAVYRIVMDVLSQHFANDKETYYELSDEVAAALRKRYSA